MTLRSRATCSAILLELGESSTTCGVLQLPMILVLGDAMVACLLDDDDGMKSFCKFCTM